MSVLCSAMRRAGSMPSRPRHPIGTVNAICKIPYYEFVKPATSNDNLPEDLGDIRIKEPLSSPSRASEPGVGQSTERDNGGRTEAYRVLILEPNSSTGTEP